LEEGFTDKHEYLMSKMKNMKDNRPDELISDDDSSDADSIDFDAPSDDDGIVLDGGYINEEFSEELNTELNEEFNQTEQNSMDNMLNILEKLAGLENKESIIDTVDDLSNIPPLY
jgi:hypothetical protein